MKRRCTIRKERERIARAIGLVVLGVAPLGALSQACSSSDTNAQDADGGGDTQVDAIGSDSPANPLDATGDSNDASCTLSATYFDAGRTFDAEGGGVDLSCTYNLPCGLPPTIVAVGCETFLGEADSSPDAYVPLGCWIPEGLGCTDGSITPSAEGALNMTCLDCFGSGRRPRGLRPARVSASTTMGAYLARMAHDEAASVLAFDRMIDELSAFGAPRELRSAAARAKRDEVSHARVMSGFASACGAVPRRPRMRRPRARSLEAMAIENAVEGCVIETFGAMLLTWQSRFAPSAELRRAFRKIARDEIDHAALAWSVGTWAETRLDSASQRRVRRARDRALDTLAKSADLANAIGCEDDVGLPNPAQRRTLIARFVASLRENS